MGEEIENFIGMRWNFFVMGDVIVYRGMWYVVRGIYWDF